MNQVMNFSTIMLGLIGLNIIVFVHEMGHFIFARLVGVRVLTFSLGFGPKLIRKTYKDCEFAISLLPLGGYCRMQGESQVHDGMTIKPGDLYYGSPWRRIMAVIGGPLFSILFAWLTFFGMGFFNQTTINLPTQVVVAENDAVDFNYDTQSAFQTGDTILTINGQPMKTFVDVIETIMHHPREVLIFEVLRNDTLAFLTIQTTLDTDKGIGKLSQTLIPWINLEVTRLVPESSAQQAGLLEGDVIKAVNGLPVTHLQELRTVMATIKNNDVNSIYITINRNNEPMEFNLVLDESGVMGVIFLQSTQLPPLSLKENWSQSFIQLNQTLISYIKGLKLLFGGAVKIDKAISGPVRTTNFIGETLGSVSTDGWHDALHILGLFSLILGITNLLPIPMLDGGLILLFITEWMNKGNTLSSRTLYIYQLIGLAIIGFLMIISLRSDFLFLTDWFLTR
jgi:regulator of sigma E protease